MKISRREFFEVCGVATGMGIVAAAGVGCGGAESPEVELTVGGSADGRSVYEATAARYGVIVEAYPEMGDGRMVIRLIDRATGRAVLDSRRLVFEINGIRYDGSFDSAEGTLVRAGDVITWKES